MKLYEYDADGWCIGWHTEAGRARSTTIPPDGIPPHRARWDGATWVDDATREDQEEATRRAHKEKRRATGKALRAFDATTATEVEVRAMVGVLTTIALAAFKDEG